MSSYHVLLGRAEDIIPQLNIKFNLTFLDPPFNQGKTYREHNDSLPDNVYWGFIEDVVREIYDKTKDGGAIYFLQREKNVAKALNILENVGFVFQNLIIWKKMTSAVPQKRRYSKSYQVLIFATKGEKPLTFNRLRIDKPLPINYRIKRPNGVYVTDIWDDIRELTSGYLAGEEAIRTKNGELFTKEGKRFHKQQSPITLLTRIILTSSLPNDVVLDACAGTGTLAVVAKQLSRRTVSIEIDPKNVDCINQRLEMNRKSDQVQSLISYYRFTQNLEAIWSGEVKPLVLEMMKQKKKEKPIGLLKYM